MKLKSLSSFKIDSHCSTCKIPFIIQTPDGGEYESCPICGWDPNHKNPDINKWRNTDNYLEEEEECTYCFTCNIIYQSGSIHCRSGCTDSTFFSSLYVPKNKEITKLSDIEIPIFTSYNEANEFLLSIKNASLQASLAEQKEDTKENYKWFDLCNLQKKCSTPTYIYPKYNENK